MRGEFFARLAKYYEIVVEDIIGAEAFDFATEQRLRRALDDLEIVHVEIERRRSE